MKKDTWKKIKEDMAKGGKVSDFLDRLIALREAKERRVGRKKGAPK